MHVATNPGSESLSDKTFPAKVACLKVKSSSRNPTDEQKSTEVCPHSFISSVRLWVEEVLDSEHGVPQTFLPKIKAVCDEFFVIFQIICHP